MSYKYPVVKGLENPALKYKEIRGKCPVTHTDGFGGGWEVLTHEDITKTALDPETFSNAGAIRYSHLPRYPFEADPPTHTIYRKMLNGLFSNKSMQKLEPKIRFIANDIFSRIFAKDEVDIAKELNYELPVRGIIAFLNLPDEDWKQISEWAEEIYFSGAEGDRERRVAVAEELRQYCMKVVKNRRENPIEGDLATKMLESEIDGQPVTDEIVAGVLHLLLTAGHESTTSSLGIIINYLAQNQHHQDYLRENTDKIPMAIEEILRWESPVQFHPRTVTKDTEIQGCPISKGETVFLNWASGNRDEKVFEDPDEVKLDRNPKKSLVFGAGVHKCLGAPIARLQLKIGIEELLSQTKSFKPNGDTVHLGFTRYGFYSLPIIIEK